MWGNFSKEVTDKCFKKVTVESTLKIPYSQAVRMKIMIVKAETVHIHDSELNFKQFGTTPFLTRVCQFISQKCCFCSQDPEIPIMFSMQRTALLIFLFYSGLLPFVPLRESLLEIMLPVTMIR